MGDFFEKAKKVAGMAADKAGDVAEMGKQKAKIVSLKSEIGAAEKRIGRFYYEKFKEDETVDLDIIDAIKEITEKEALIEEMEDAIQKIKDEGR